MEKAKTKEQWEEAFVIALVRLRDFFSQEDGETIVGTKKATAVEGLIESYFRERRRRIPIPIASPLMNYEDMALFINDTVLSYISDEKAELLELDWKQTYVLRSENENLFNEEDSEGY